MRTITISNRSKALKELLTLATQDDILLQTTDGAQFVLSRLTQAESFQIGESDELADELMESRKNVALMKFLDQRGERAKGRRGTPLAEVRQKLHL
jgi:hypothetical protein